MAEPQEELQEEISITSSDGMINVGVINPTVEAKNDKLPNSEDLIDLTEICSDPEFSSNKSHIDLTLENNPTKEDVLSVHEGPQLIRLHINTSSNSSCTRKHKIPEIPIVDQLLTKDCSPSKIPKMQSKELGADYFNVSLSNSTVTSASGTNFNGDNSANFDMQTPTNEACRIQEDSLIDLQLENPLVYYHVLDMFPDIEKNYLINQCKGFDVNQIINTLLESNNNYPKEKETLMLMPISAHHNISSNSSKDFEEVSTSVQSSKVENAELDFLINILPDADPSFLETKISLTKNQLSEFIYEALERKNYPRLNVKVEKKAESSEDDLGLYTTAFNVDHFLNIFPEPIKYFMDENRKCQPSTHALEFLKRGFRNHTVKLITVKYKEFGYNLARTFEALEAEPPSRISKRLECEIKIPEQKNLPFVQEACFVEHKSEIQFYMQSKVEAKRLAYELAKKRGELIECGCCYEESMFEECAACNEGDLFCKACIKKSTEVRIGDGLTTFPCLLECGAQFSLHLLQNLLNANMFSRLLRRIQLEEVRAADIDGLEVCPFCEFATIPSPDTNIFTCLNPECLKESCRKCHKVSHIPQRCEEVENDDQAQARKYIENEMTKALVRECYKCKKSFIKQDGCNKMTCTCGAKMCYICRKPIVNYNHFNGPGGADKERCPLYSTDKVLHVDAVKAVAEQAKERLNTTNPSLTLKHDPTKLLPTARTKSALPPGVQENAAALLIRLQGQLHQEAHPPNLHPVLPNVRNFVNLNIIAPTGIPIGLHPMCTYNHWPNPPAEPPLYVHHQLAAPPPYVPNHPAAPPRQPATPPHDPAAPPHVPNHDPAVPNNEQNILPPLGVDYLEQLEDFDDLMEDILLGWRDDLRH